jgi:hypothetical protein
MGPRCVQVISDAALYSGSPVQPSAFRQWSGPVVLIFHRRRACTAIHIRQWRRFCTDQPTSSSLGQRCPSRPHPEASEAASRDEMCQNPCTHPIRLSVIFDATFACHCCFHYTSILFLFQRRFIDLVWREQHYYSNYSNQILNKA